MLSNSHALTLVEEVSMMLRLVVLVFGVLLMFISPASGQTIDSKSVVGTWAGMLDVQGSDRTPGEVSFNSDGGFKGSVKNQTVGLVTMNGKWRIEGQNVLVDYVATPTTATANTPPMWTSSWTLTSPQSNTLSGFGIRKSDNLQYDVKLNKK
jgi:hypothetical protein